MKEPRSKRLYRLAIRCYVLCNKYDGTEWHAVWYHRGRRLYLRAMSAERTGK